MDPKPCEHCAEMFVPVRSSARFCSRKCSQAQYYQENKEHIAQREAQYQQDNKERDRYREALEQANLALIEARNPGIDMEAVKRQRSAALAPNTEGEGTMGEYRTCAELEKASKSKKAARTPSKPRGIPKTRITREFGAKTFTEVGA